MMIINTSLLRERFIIKNQKGQKPPLIVRSNRMMLKLVSKNGEIKERFVIRTKSMHSTLRIGAEITRTFYKVGPIINRQKPFNWNEMWEAIFDEFDKLHYPDTWVCVYHLGKPIFQRGDYHPFLDIIEQCDIKNRDEYDRAIPLAIETFKSAGQNVDIDHAVNIASVIGVTQTQTRCGLILRSASSTSTFNFSIRKKIEDGSPSPKYDDGLYIAAIYLEGIELAYNTGIARKKIEENAPEIDTSLNRFERAAYSRIGRLNQRIKQYETIYNISYRPEKPDFIELLNQAEENGAYYG